MHNTALKLLSARYVWKRRFVQITACMDKYVTAILECLSAADIQELHFPFAIRLNPSGMLNTMREADILAQLVFCAESGKVSFDL